MDVELRHLRAFVAVARRRSFTRAAGELLVTQPALSRTVAQLESIVSVRLLDRSSRHVELTGAGEEFLLQAERVLATLDQALAGARRTATLRLGFSWLLPDPWAQQAVRRFEGGTGASVALTRVDDPLLALRRRAVDIVVVRGDAEVPRQARTMHLYDEPRIAVCSHHSDLCRHRSLDWTQVRNWPLVVNTVSGSTGPWSWHQDQRPEHIVETANYDEWLETVAAGRGIGVVPTVVKRRTPHPALRFVKLTNAPPSPVRLVFLADSQPTLVRHFLQAALPTARA
ncbi:LysR family transcriptional regulator [Streptomyces sp. MMG1121]|uniref:LysR family transcriptional regulator n=1 Tax=Streptomyces sp. MMG1121 TaxID=1415544 RepID=UPI0006AEBD46|nr:LysR family transcriptional regulator [Streptomyces sp. MMG1121]